MNVDQLILTINKPHVNSEIFEDEVVVVNLLNGFYYSLNKAGIDVWILIEKKIPKDQILNIFIEKYPDQPVKEEVSDFINELIQESLVIEVKQDENNSIEILDILNIEYRKPLIEKYSDMQDLLMLDPIHDIDESGWPKKPVEVNKEKEKQN